MGNNILAVAALVTGLLLTGCSGGGGDSDKDKPGSGNPPPAGGGNPPPGNQSGTSGTAFFLPTADEVRNTVNPRVETDRAGNVHTVFPAHAIGDAFYTYCGSDCDPDTMVSIKLPTEGTVVNAMLAIGPDNKPQILLSTYLRLYYATCETDCSQASGWSISLILEHSGNLEVSGEAFAITPDGKLGFIMHSSRPLFGSSPTPATWYMTCETSCEDPAEWVQSQIASDVWQETSLHYTADGQPRLATVLKIDGVDTGAYLECDGTCSTEDDWAGVTIVEAFSNRLTEDLYPAISLDLTTADRPRVVMLGKADGQRTLAYYECDLNCADGNNWRGGELNRSDKIGAGLDLVLDSADRPRFVYTADSNILLAYCDERCTDADAPWKLTKVEFGGDMKPDEIIPYPNCTVGAWFLRSPSLALGADGLPRVGYRALDISGGTSNPDPTKPSCAAGADMTFARFMQMTGY